MNTVIDKSGQRRELLDGEIMNDGDRLIVTVHLMDGTPHALHDGMGRAAGNKPGYVFPAGATVPMSDAVLDAARDEYDTKLTSAWRTPAIEQAPPVADADRDAYATYAKRLGNAWRSV